MSNGLCKALVTANQSDVKTEQDHLQDIYK
jgi:hypothetical protein